MSSFLIFSNIIEKSFCKLETFSRRFLVDKVKHLCAQMDISIEEMRMAHSLKVPYTRPSPEKKEGSVPNLPFSRGRGGYSKF